MPYKDGTGPLGQGPKTGRQAGNCPGAQGQQVGPGRGRGRGLGLGLRQARNARPGRGRNRSF